MALATPFDSSFWEFGGKKPSGSANNTRDYNKNMWGSETVNVSYDQDGHQYWHSNLTNNDYNSAAEAVSAENDFRNHTGSYAPGAGNPILDAATGEQAPIQNPNAPTADIIASVTPPATFPSSTPRQPARGTPGFTDELTAIAAKRPAQDTVSRPPQASIYGTPDTKGANLSGLPTIAGAPGAGGGTQPSIDTTNPGSPAPTIDRAKIDAILDPLRQYQSDIYNLSQDNTGQSVAELQLQKAYDIAKANAADQLAANQAGALGAARSARNRGDRALLERQAIGEQSYLGSQAQRQQAAADRELGYNQALLRAQEEDYDRRFKLEALKTAGSLGLDQAALEKDISTADLASATNWINQEFQQLGLDKQLGQSADQFAASLDADKMKTILGFTQAMAAIQYQYDQLSVQDQNEADQLLMQKYGIDQNTMVALKQIKQQGKFKWDQVLTALVGGAATGGTGALAHAALTGGGGGGGGTGFDNDVSTVYNPNV